MVDALEIMTNLEHVHPYFQAVFSGEEQEVVGYEVLGRITFQGEVKSLGDFFWDESIPNEYKVEVESIVIQKAIEAILSEDKEYILFLNQNPNVLVWDEKETILQLLLQYEEKGLQLSRIVLEITPHLYEGDIHFLKNLISYYRTYGIRIAVDRIGKESSNLDQIRMLHPDILKIDLHDLKVSIEAQSNYQDVLVALSTLARRMGATLLFEEIEDEHHLQSAFVHGGRYYEGYYLHRPSPCFVEKKVKKDWLNEKFQVFIRHSKKKLFSVHQFSERFNEQVASLVNKGESTNMEEMLQYLCQSLHTYSFRLYICNEDGIQLSPNFVKRNEKWMFEYEFLGKNWSWRPYFLDNIVRMKETKKGRLSDVYTDIETGKTIRTFSYPMEKDTYLFIDISYEYLYENHVLL
ncbi:MAG: EAL-associated domain-containing protein [Bacillaceae bacterium]